MNPSLVGIIIIVNVGIRLGRTALNILSREEVSSACSHDEDSKVIPPMHSGSLSARCQLDVIAIFERSFFYLKISLFVLFFQFVII